MKPLIVSDPYTGEELARLPWAGSREISVALDKARRCSASWRSSPAHERSALLLQALRNLEMRRDEFVDLLIREAGKPLTYAEAEVGRALGVLEWAAAETLRFGGELLRLDVAAAGSREGFGIHQRFPRGVVLGITPFNFPLNLVLHKVAPAVACGCPIVIKPSPDTPLMALRVKELFEEAPEGLITVLNCTDEDTAALTQAKEIATVSFTGSARVGWQIRRQAPLKPTTLELGGNAWVIVHDLERSAFERVARRIADAAYGYAGQSCISVQNIAIRAGKDGDEFRDALVAAVEATGFGHPREQATVAGPLIHGEAERRVREATRPVTRHCIVSRQKIDGATDSARAHHYSVMEPTLVDAAAAGLKDDSPLVREEIFGPVALVHRFEKLPGLIDRINSGVYGLQTGIFSQDLGVIHRAYRDLDVGGVIVNHVPTTRYDHQPYGGNRESGRGREGIRYAMEEMTESKFLALSPTVC